MASWRRRNQGGEVDAGRMCRAAELGEEQGRRGWRPGAGEEEEGASGPRATVAGAVEEHLGGCGSEDEEDCVRRCVW